MQGVIPPAHLNAGHLFIRCEHVRSPDEKLDIESVIFLEDKSNFDSTISAFFNTLEDDVALAGHRVAGYMEPVIIFGKLVTRPINKADNIARAVTFLENSDRGIEEAKTTFKSLEHDGEKFIVKLLYKDAVGATIDSAGPSTAPPRPRSLIHHPIAQLQYQSPPEETSLSDGEVNSGDEERAFKAPANKRKRDDLGKCREGQVPRPPQGTGEPPHNGVLIGGSWNPDAGNTEDQDNNASGPTGKKRVHKNPATHTELNEVIRVYIPQDPKTGKFIAGSKEDPEQKGEALWRPGLEALLNKVWRSGHPAREGLTRAGVRTLAKNKIDNRNRYLRKPASRVPDKHGVSAMDKAKEAARHFQDSQIGKAYKEGRVPGTECGHEWNGVQPQPTVRRSPRKAPIERDGNIQVESENDAKQETKARVSQKPLRYQAPRPAPSIAPTLVMKQVQEAAKAKAAVKAANGGGKKQAANKGAKGSRGRKKRKAKEGSDAEDTDLTDEDGHGIAGAQEQDDDV